LAGLPGLKGYDCYEHSGQKGLTESREWEYPPYLSIVYFKNNEAFENYEKSRELIAYQKAIRNIFPNGLNLRWYIQYQLVKSWRK
jgi:heme-degrading monooxygenase HmoA